MAKHKFTVSSNMANGSGLTMIQMESVKGPFGAPLSFCPMPGRWMVMPSVVFKVKHEALVSICAMFPKNIETLLDKCSKHKAFLKKLDVAIVAAMENLPDEAIDELLSNYVPNMSANDLIKALKKSMLETQE